MKTTRILSLIALASGAMALSQSVSAQDVVVEDQTVSVTEFTCDPKTHYSSNWRDNWFIQVGAGINQPFVERSMFTSPQRKAIDRQKMTAVYNFGFGRWFSPYLGVRVNFLGGSLHWDTPTADHPNDGWSKANHINMNVELMWDMFNSFAGPNPDRVFSIIPFVGIGGDYLWNMRDDHGNVPVATNIVEHKTGKLKNQSWTLPVTAGLQFRFRLCKYVDFFAEARASFYGDNWNNVAYGDAIEANVAVLGGFNFNIGGRTFNSYNECASLSQMAALNNEVNVLRGQLLDAAQTIAGLESQLPCPEPKVITNTLTTEGSAVMATVRFSIDSAVITPEEEVNVYNMAEWLKANPEKNVTIIGYADKDTGTSEYNMELSKKRADAVADQLVNKYGIAKDRLTVKYDGSDVQPYTTNNWNRIVIFTEP